jgi:hypothetical protein
VVFVILREAVFPQFGTDATFLSKGAIKILVADGASWRVGSLIWKRGRGMEIVGIGVRCRREGLLYSGNPSPQTKLLGLNFSYFGSLIPRFNILPPP